MNFALITLHVTAVSLLDSATTRLQEDEGQTTMEWMGIAAIVVGILAVLLTNAGDLGDIVQAAWTRLFNAATGG